jgi:tetratricopeptide (TPR) repeat protein
MAGEVRRVCPQCAERVVRAGHGGNAVIYVLIVIIAWILFGALYPGASIAGAALALLMIAGAFAVHVVVHEAAHALAGLAMGMEVPEVELGDGQALVRLRLGSTVVNVGGLHSGTTRLEPRSSRLLRTRLALACVAGPLGNFALAATAHWLVDPPSAAAEWFTRFVIGAGMVLGVLSLAPMRVSFPSETVQSDGAALLALLRAGRDAGDQIVAASRLDASRRRHLTGEGPPSPDEPPVDSTDPVVLAIEGTRRILTGEYEKAVALLREALLAPLPDDARALPLNNLAWALLVAQPYGWLDEADRASAGAISIKPWMEAMMGTRGCILAHRGDLEEARRLLRRAVQGDAARGDQVILYRHLFRAEHGLGNLYGARAALLALVDHGAKPEEVELARAQLRPWEVDNALANLVGADGLIHWPDPREGDAQARHIKEMRRALMTFTEEACDDPRRDAVRLGLGE